MKDLSKKFCFKPWDHLEIGPGQTHRLPTEYTEDVVYPCCSNWINRYHFGKIDKDIKFNDVWNSDKAKKFRQSILDGSYKYCNKTLCPWIQNNNLPDVDDVISGKHGEEKKNIYLTKELHSDYPNYINLCYDKSCNLKCPSCRKDFEFLTEKNDSELYLYKLAHQKNLIEYLYTCKTKTCVNITGSGDPFASRLFWELITSFDGIKNPLLQFQFQTNGVLFTEENWNKMKNLHNNCITAVISLDAGTEETYNYTRRGGDWNKLMNNLQFVKRLFDEKKLWYVRLDFVCQQKNYKEIPLFIDIAKKYNFHCYLSRIDNWGTYSEEEFKVHNIFDKHHPEHSEFLKIVNQTYDYEFIDFGNLSEFRK